MSAFTSLLAHNGCLGLFKGQGDYETKIKGRGGIVWTRAPDGVVPPRLRPAEAYFRTLAPAAADVELEGSVQAYAALAEDEAVVETRMPRRGAEKKIRTALPTILLEQLQQAFPLVDRKFAYSVWESHQGHRSTIFVLAAIVDRYGRLPPSVGRAPDLSPVGWPVLGGRRDFPPGRGRLVSGGSDAGSDWDVVSSGDDHVESDGWEIVKAESSYSGDEGGEASTGGGAVALPRPKVSYACIVLSFIPTAEASQAAAAAASAAAPPLRRLRTPRRNEKEKQKVLYTDACEMAESYDAVELQAHNKYGVARLRGFDMSKMRPQQAAQRAKRIAAKGRRAAG